MLNFLIIISGKMSKARKKIVIHVGNSGIVGEGLGEDICSGKEAMVGFSARMAPVFS